jgi:nucleotide-binding universal stress UspA family protein
MYQKILVTLDATPTDRVILEHVKALAKSFNSRLILLHVADGWTARTYGAQGISPEIEEDRQYLARIQEQLKTEGIHAEAELAFGKPAAEIVKWVNTKHCDLIAMSTHGHRFFADLFLGVTAVKVQHQVSVPVLLLRAK